jgi:predicted glycogen debranching enzyme
MPGPPELPALEFPDAVEFGRELCSNLAAAESREWLVTNGIGGYAMGTISGIQTRSYHGLLMAALHPPRGRTMLLSRLDETVVYQGNEFLLAANRWAGSAVEPQGYLHIERFHLEGTTPVWTFALGEALVEKRVFLEQGANTTYVLYRVVRAASSMNLRIKVIVDNAAEHSVTSAGDLQFEITPVSNGMKIAAENEAVPFYVLSNSGSFEITGEWYRNYDLPAERARGLRDRADRYFAGSVSADLGPGEELVVAASTDSHARVDGEMPRAKRQQTEFALLDKFLAAAAPVPGNAPPAIRQLVLAANQFISARPMEGFPDGRTILAGFPWFGAWGRDTMISLPGLCLVTGRPALARKILTTYARLVNEGMLPNLLPESGAAVEYNSADASLWYFQAAREYFEATKDEDLLRELFPVLDEIVNAYLQGARHHIHVDQNDGLVYAGEDGLQLTWMDAKVNGRVITPRIGKPVELSALWFNAMKCMARFASVLERDPGPYESHAERTHRGFERFWNSATNYCYDVIDGQAGATAFDPSIRPNAIFAVSLPESMLSLERQRAVVDLCERELLTPYGLRSLGPREPDYRGHYSGGVEERDSAYHQGTVWGWLVGPFALAHWRVHQDRAAALSFLEPLLHHVTAAGVGTLGEIFDGEEPFAARGCIAQAWTVAEVLRAWRALTV